MHTGGVQFLDSLLKRLGIQPSFLTLAENSEPLTPKYYLQGMNCVGDAGDLLKLGRGLDPAVARLYS
jgi:hypothetical protein